MTGIADYSAMLLPPLAERLDLVAASDQSSIDLDGVRTASIAELQRESFDVLVAQMGNNLHHEPIYRFLTENAGPSVLVLHDIVLHHLIAEITLARGLGDEYEQILEAEHRETGAAFARARAAGLHLEIGNFLLPASASFASLATRVIVHNRWARERLLELGVTSPVTVIDHPHPPHATVRSTDAHLSMRSRFGIPPDRRVIGVFGFITEAKRPAVVLEAFQRARQSDPSLHLAFVGEPGPTVDLDSLAERLGVPDEVWSATGYVPAEEFEGMLSVCDAVVALRYPSAGESSGPLVQLFRHGIPVAVSDYAQFADLPNPAVIHVPLGEGEIDRLVAFLVSPPDRGLVSEAQRRWLDQHGDLDSVVDQYVREIEAANSRPSLPPTIPKTRLEGLPLLPTLSADASVRGSTLHITLRNDGTRTLPAKQWGLPWYAVSVEIETPSDRWSFLEEMKGDLSAGASVSFEVDVGEVPYGTIVRLAHYQDRLPGLSRPFYQKEIQL